MSIDIEVDLDQHPAPAEPDTWLDHPKRIAAAVAAVGVLAIAVVAVTMPSLRTAPAPAAVLSPAGETCPAAVPPLPAFTITMPVTGDLYAHEDTGRWRWRQMVWLPATLGDRHDATLIELQTANGVIGVTADGPHQLAISSGTAVVAVLDFDPGAVYDQWASLVVTSTDIPGGDVLTVALSDTDGGTVSQAAPMGDAFHSSLTGFGMLIPAADAAGERVKYGPPAFSPDC